MTATTNRPAVVVGAGPAGLTAALALRAAGLPALVLEKRGVDDVRPGSRAAYLHGESLRHLEALSPRLGRAIAAEGVMWSTKRTLWRGREVYAKTYSPVDSSTSGRLPPFTSLPQVRTEDLLYAACERAGVEFSRQHHVTDVQVTADGVTVVDDHGGRVEADYVIAADGSRSPVRTAIGRSLEGPTSRHPFVVVDLADDPALPMPRERVFHYQHPAVDGRNVLIVPFAGGWRVDLALRPGDDVEAFTAPAGVAQWIDLVMPTGYGARVTWVSTYRFAQQTAASFVDDQRRVALVGEAAHLFAPFGARGMNSSVPDAIAAADAVYAALVEKPGSSAAHAAFDRFASERRAAALYNRQCATQALAHMLALRPTVKLRRIAAARLADAGLRAGRWLDSAPYGPGVAKQARPGRSY